jgi:polyisoprenoid-binding protein YceI
VAAFAVLALGGLTAPVPAEPARYTIDPEHLAVGFLVEHIGYAKILGMFTRARGGYIFDEASGALRELELVIETDSVFSNHEKRDKHLRGSDFLNTAEFPEMTFRAPSGRPTGERTYAVAGELTLLGRTRPVTLQATWNKSGPYPFGSGLLGAKPYVMGVSARGSFRRSEFGMSYAVANGWVGDEVELLIELEARRE